MKQQELDSKLWTSPKSFFSLIKEFSEAKDQSPRSLLYLALLEKFEFPDEKDVTDIARWVKSIETGLEQKDSTILVLHRMVLAMAYQYGVGVPKNRVHAYTIYQALLQEEPDNSLVLNNLAYCYQYGCGVQRDDTRAFALLNQAAAQGDPASVNNLAICFRDGIGTTQDIDQAASFFEAAAQSNNHKALHHQGNLDNKDHVIKMLHLGSVPALNSVREFYGRDEALRYLEIAAERHNLQAWFILGNFYRWGSLLTQADTAPPGPADLEKALEYYQRVADSVDIEEPCPPDYGHWPDCWPDIVITLNYVANAYKELINDAKSVAAEKACVYFEKLTRIHKTRRASIQNLKPMDLDFCRAYLFLARGFRDGLGVEANLEKSNEYFQIVLDYAEQGIIISNQEAMSFYGYQFYCNLTHIPAEFTQFKDFYYQLWRIPHREPFRELLLNFKKAKGGDRNKLFVALLDRFQYPSSEDDDEAKTVIPLLESKGDNDLIVGLAYQYGLGVVKDHGQAFNHYSMCKNLNTDHPDRSMLTAQLIECHRYGYGVEENRERAATLLKAEKKIGNPAIKIKNLMIPNSAIAAEFAINLGSTPAFTRRTLFSFMWPYTDLFENLLEMAAKRNEPEALRRLLERHDDFSNEENIPILIVYQRRLSILIDSTIIDSAEYDKEREELIKFYFRISKGLADISHSYHDYEKSFSYYNQILKYFGTKQGNILKDESFFYKIYYSLALCHRDGLGTVIDLQKYFEYLKIAATHPSIVHCDNLFANTQYLLALSYWQGIGTSENVTESLKICQFVYSLNRCTHFLERSHKRDFSLLVGKIAVKDFKEPHSGLALLKFLYAAFLGSREGLYLLIKNFNFQRWRYCLEPYQCDSYSFDSRNTSLLTQCMPPRYTNYREYGVLDSLPILFFYGSELYAANGFNEQHHDEDEKNIGEDPAAMIMRACYYQNGIAGMEKNSAKAMQLLQEQAEAGVGLAYFLQGYAFADGIECKKDLTAAALLYRKAIFLGCDALDFLARLSRENPRNLKVMYHYCMSDVKKLIEQLARNSKVIFRLWQEEYQSLPNSEFKDFSLSRMLEAKPGQYPWHDKVFYQLGMDEIEEGISKQQNKENKEIKSVSENIKRGVEFFSSTSPENLSPSANFDVGFFLFNLRMGIQHLDSPETAKKIYSHWKKAAMDGNIDARRYLLGIASSRFKQSGFAFYQDYVREDELFSAENFTKFQSGFFSKLTSPGKNHGDQKDSEMKSAPVAEMKPEIKLGWGMSLLTSTFKTPGQGLHELFPDFFVQNSQEKDEFYLCSSPPMNTQQANSFVEKLETIVREADSSIGVLVDKVDPSFDECTIKLSNVTKATLNKLARFHRQIHDLAAAPTESLDLPEINRLRPG